MRTFDEEVALKRRCPGRRTFANTAPRERSVRGAPVADEKGNGNLDFPLKDLTTATPSRLVEQDTVRAKPIPRHYGAVTD